MVGVACALELQRRGREVVLVDRQSPGRETSYGNAGVLTRSSLMPFNHPGLWRDLPRLLRNRSTAFRYRLPYMARQAAWGLGFLARARESAFLQTATALDALIRLSMPEHRRLLHEAGESRRLRETGWLFLYRTTQAFDAGARARAAFERFGVATEVLDGTGLSGLEPALRPIFPRALWIRDAASVDDPGGVVAAYARLFAQRGGVLRQDEATDLKPEGDGSWALHTATGRWRAAQVVLALGPWTARMLARLGLSVPMAFERGYHMHYAAPSGATLGRPVYDTGGGYVMAPLAQGLRLTTGVELADLDAPASTAQLDLAERAAREALPLGSRLEREPWLGRRPTLPDCRPAIGAAPRHPGLWLAFGHQHVGFNTGPGTARVLAALMHGEAPPIDARPFDPGRFVR